MVQWFIAEQTSESIIWARNLLGEKKHYLIQNREPAPGHSAGLKRMFINHLSGMIKEIFSYILIEIYTEFVSGRFLLSFFSVLNLWSPTIILS